MISATSGCSPTPEINQQAGGKMILHNIYVYMRV